MRRQVQWPGDLFFGSRHGASELADHTRPAHRSASLGAPLSPTLRGAGRRGVRLSPVRRSSDCARPPCIDYVSFMVVVGSLFVVSGGIHLRVKAPSGPARNTLFLLFGAVLANLIGTIGASLLLIRPWIRMNKGRVVQLHIAFFIFLVSNLGGALLPVGPPLSAISGSSRFQSFSRHSC